MSTKAATAGNSYFGLATGMVLFVGVECLGPISGGVFNPAAGVGLWLAKGLMGDNYPACVVLYVLAPPAGAALAALTFVTFAPPSELLGGRPTAPTAGAKMTTEAIGTFFLVFTIAASSRLNFGETHVGFILAAMVYMGGPVSGGHFNPAVSLAVCLRGKLSPIHWLLYSAVQTASAVCAGATSAWVFGTNVAPCPSDASALGWARAGACEALFTFALCLVVLHVSTKAATAGNSYFGLATGMVLFVGVECLGPISGGVFNPAAGVGLWLAKGLVSDNYPACVALYVLAPPAGAALSAFVFRAFTHRVDGKGQAPTLGAKLTIESVGAFFLAFVMASNHGHVHTVGWILAAMVYMGGPVSGGHFNPAVSLAVCLRGKLSPIHWLLYSAVQTASAVCAGATSAWVFGTNVAPCPSDASALGWARAGACEALFTFALCLVVLHVSTKAATAGNSYFGLATGFSVYAGIVSVGAVSGGVFNPAVGVGLWLADGLMGGGYPPCVALYVLAPPVGASIAALLFRACSPRVLGRVWMA